MENSMEAKDASEPAHRIWALQQFHICPRYPSFRATALETRPNRQSCALRQAARKGDARLPRNTRTFCAIREFRRTSTGHQCFADGFVTARSRSKDGNRR